MPQKCPGTLEAQIAFPSRRPVDPSRGPSSSPDKIGLDQIVRGVKAKPCQRANGYSKRAVKASVRGEICFWPFLFGWWWWEGGGDRKTFTLSTVLYLFSLLSSENLQCLRVLISKPRCSGLVGRPPWSRYFIRRISLRFRRKIAFVSHIFSGKPLFDFPRNLYFVFPIFSSENLYVPHIFRSGGRWQSRQPMCKQNARMMGFKSSLEKLALFVCCFFIYLFHCIW